MTDQTTATTTATGNNFDGSVLASDADMRSNQTLQGDVSADTRLDVAVHSGPVAVLNTTAVGNSGVSAVDSATLTAVINQNTGAVAVTGHSHVEAPDATGGDVSSSVQALGNSQTLGATYASSGVRVNQTNAATVTSDGGGVYGVVTGTANFTAMTAANNVTSAGVSDSASRLSVRQRNDAALTQAGQFTAYGNAYLATTSATATGNNISATNDGSLLDVTADQANNAYVRAQAQSSGYAYGAGQAVAYGVGNTLMAGDVGGAVVIDNTQLNDGGGIESVASYTGYQGYDAGSTATAIGNAATGYACSDCQGVMTVSNRQTNNVDVGATSSTSITGYARSATGVATAVGNTASYYVTRPTP